MNLYAIVTTSSSLLVVGLKLYFPSKVRTISSLENSRSMLCSARWWSLAVARLCGTIGAYLGAVLGVGGSL